MRRTGSDRAALVVAAALALALHASFLGGVGFAPQPAGDASTVAPMAVRTVAAKVDPSPPAMAPPPAPATAEAEPPATPDAAPARSAAAAKRTSRVSTSTELPAPVGAEVAAADPASAPAAAASASVETPAVAAAAVAEALPEAAAPSEPPAPTPAVEASASSPASGGQPLRDLGAPPPTWRVVLPPPLIARYEVRRGFLRGTGEIRWQPAGERYTMQLEARIGSIVLLVQSSEGSIGPVGLVPRRFVDQRVRRAAQAANFDSDAGRITFSGPQAVYPFYAGTQDRLSLFVQLAGIAAADPSRLVDGAAFPMVVVGARGDAAVWNLRVAGREAVETASGAVQAIKVVREARSPSDTAAEIWLDPGRHYLPAHATLRNASGASEYDLLLEGVSSGP